MEKREINERGGELWLKEVELERVTAPNQENKKKRWIESWQEAKN